MKKKSFKDRLKPKWDAFYLCDTHSINSPEDVQKLHPGIPFDAAQRIYQDEIAGCEWWRNNRYLVSLKKIPPHEAREGWPEMIHLSIKRIDKEVIHDWRDLQRIKNELVGPEHEAIELYPAESRLMDCANQYHLWCFAVPFDVACFPVGYFGERATDDKRKGPWKQRPFDSGSSSTRSTVGQNELKRETEP